MGSRDYFSTTHTTNEDVGNKPSHHDWQKENWYKNYVIWQCLKI